MDNIGQLLDRYADFDFRIDMTAGEVALENDRKCRTLLAVL